MSRSLLDLPPELLVHTLTLLPIQALLRFGETCKYSHTLANSSLHTLSLGIHSSRVSGIISKLASTQYPQPKKTISVFSIPKSPPAVVSSSSSSTSSYSSSSSSLSSRRSSLESDLFADEAFDGPDPHRVSVLIPDAQAFDYDTLLSFHSALTKSILTRHGGTLRNLDLSLWTLTTPVVKVLANLSALRVLSIRIEDFLHVRAIPRNHVTGQRNAQRDAWSLLTETAIWAPRLQALRIEGGELSTVQLARLLGQNRWCHEVWLCKCNMIGKEVWSWLGGEWEGRSALRILGVMRCGGQLDEESLDAIGGMRGLQFLSLQGCYGVDCDDVEKRNRDEWQIAEIVPPLPKSRGQEQDASTIIEVDPAYMEEDD